MDPASKSPLAYRIYSSQPSFSFSAMAIVYGKIFIRIVRFITLESYQDTKSLSHGKHSQRPPKGEKIKNKASLKVQGGFEPPNSQLE